jgi:hypothetical protein
MNAKLFLIIPAFVSRAITYGQENPSVQPVASSTVSYDSLLGAFQAVKKDAELFKNLKISGWVQSQFQLSDTLGARNFDGGDFPANSDTRFMIRRGRIKFTYNQKNSQYVMQINGSERGVSLVDIFGKYSDPWKHVLSITAGVFNRPFSYEIQQSSVDRESPERSRWAQTYLPNERDIGAMLTFAPKSRALNGLKVDAGFFNGTGIAVPGTGAAPGATLSPSGATGVSGLTDFDRFKDFMGHAAFYRSLKEERIKYGIGVSGYYGGFVLQNNKVYNAITTDSLGNKVWKIADTSARMYKGSLAPRIYYGMEALFSIKTILGTTTIRGEYYTGTQTGRDVDSRSPATLPSATAAMYVRNFTGGYAYFIQRIAETKHELAFKYEWVDPNTKVSAGDLNGTNGMKEGEIKYTVMGIGYNLYLDPHVKFMFCYNMVTNEAAKIAGYSRDLKDNILTIRMQYRF